MTADSFRQDTPALYSREEARSIKQQVAEGREPVFCPRCRKELVFAMPILQGLVEITQVRCLDCNRSIVIRKPRGG